MSAEPIPLTRPAPRAIAPRPLPLLENGATLDADEFMRRYERMPDLKKAELIDGVVYMGSPVRASFHGRPDNVMQVWLGTYAIAVPGVEAYSNSTAKLSRKDVPQPDVCLCLAPELGGKSRLNDQGYIEGPPELVVEVAASSASLDMRQKAESYRRAGISEYLCWRTEDELIDWVQLANGRYQALPLDAKGVWRSIIFPGLWLDRTALLEKKWARVMKVLQAGLKSRASKKK